MSPSDRRDVQDLWMSPMPYTMPDGRRLVVVRLSRRNVDFCVQFSNGDLEYDGDKPEISFIDEGLVRTVKLGEFILRDDDGVVHQCTTSAFFTMADSWRKANRNKMRKSA